VQGEQGWQDGISIRKEGVLQVVPGPVHTAPVQLRVRCIGSRRQTRQSSPPKIGLAPSLCAALPDPGQPRRDPKLMDPRASTL
jgi:hypothetical protein